MNLRSLLSLLVLALSAHTLLPSLATAQERSKLLPRIGETAEEFDARVKGLPPPVHQDHSSITLTADTRGHFSVETVVNGTPIQMLVDTGASAVTLSERDAHQIGLNLSPSQFARKVSTANGVILVAPVLLQKIAIDEIVVTDVAAVVVPADKLPQSLLGMSFLSKLSHFEFREGKLVLKR
jgi:aspartyl protease family protein